MKAEYINPIVQAVMSVGNSFFSNELKKGNLFVPEKLKEFDSLLISVGITGDLNGQCILSFQDDIIKQIAGAMMGMEINEIDEMSKSAVSEFCNMIMGNAATFYSEVNNNINISTPISISGKMSVSSDNVLLGLPIWISSNKKFEVYLSAKKSS
ncbi:chemotaxis protein CheX [Natronospora cellulosivora (SeqCode)]